MGEEVVPRDLLKCFVVFLLLTATSLIFYTLLSWLKHGVNKFLDEIGTPAAEPEEMDEEQAGDADTSGEEEEQGKMNGNISKHGTPGVCAILCTVFGVLFLTGMPVMVLLSTLSKAVNFHKPIHDGPDLFY